MSTPTSASPSVYSNVDVEMGSDNPVDNGELIYKAASSGCSGRMPYSFHHANKRDIVTSRQPTFPSEYAHREGNAGMLAILGFVMATLTTSLLDVFAPNVEYPPLWLYCMCFGGLLQIYAGIKDFEHGNTLTACIFLLFGFHWVSKGFMLGDLSFLEYVGPGYAQSGSVFGCYYLVFSVFEGLLTVCCYFSPQGSWLLFTILMVVFVKLVLATIHSWHPTEGLSRAGGVFGILVCLLAFYSFFAESLAEHGTLIPTGKFAGVKSRHEVKEEINELKGK
jgi:succinate-acetate transporter protein